MQPTSCPTPEQLDAYVLGRLNENELDGIEKHLATCAVCEASVKKLDSLDQLFNADFRKGAGQPEPLVNEAEILPSTATQPAGPLLEKPLEQIGEYRILERLGGGGMATVYKAIHTRLQRTVALKMLPAERCQDPEWTSRFDREMVAIGALDDPHVVRVFDGREIEGRRVLVMEFVEGLDLGQVVRRIGPLRVADACEIIGQAAAGLQAAHQQGLVHRDIKPANLMLSLGGQVKVLDLGLARFQGAATVNELTDTDQTLGTVDYIAPEQIVDSRRVDIRADIYSLGCTLYKLLTGRSPYGHVGTVYQRMAAHFQTQPPALEEFRSDLPEGLAAVVAKMMAKTAAGRYSVPQEVSKVLEPFRQGSSLIALIQKALATPDPHNSTEAAAPAVAGEVAPPAAGAVEGAAPAAGGARSPEPPGDSSRQAPAGGPPQAGPVPPVDDPVPPPSPPPAAPPQAGPPPGPRPRALFGGLAVLAIVLLAMIAWYLTPLGNKLVTGRVIGSDPAGSTIVVMPRVEPAAHAQQAPVEGNKPTKPLVFHIGQTTLIDRAVSPAAQTGAPMSKKTVSPQVGELVEVTYASAMTAGLPSQGRAAQTAVQGQQQHGGPAASLVIYEAISIRVLAPSIVKGEGASPGK
jgi:serine/threonine protein kinase